MHRMAVPLVVRLSSSSSSEPQVSPIRFARRITIPYADDLFLPG